MAIEIVSFPSNSMVIVHSFFVNVYPLVQWMLLEKVDAYPLVN